MKIIFVSGFQEFSRALYNAFIRNDVHALYVNDASAYYVPDFLRDAMFISRLTRTIRPLKKINKALFNKHLLAICTREKPDALFTTKGSLITPETLSRIRMMGCQTALWFLDNIFDPAYHKWFFRAISCYNYFFSYHSSNSAYIARQMRDVQTQYLPIGICPEMYNQALNEHDKKKYTCDISFVGALYPEREKLLSSLTDFNLKIFGWKGWERSSLKAYYQGPVTITEAAKIYQCSTVSLNIHLNDRASGVNTRTFEIPASGGFQLCDYRDDLPALFSIGDEIITFKNEYELRDLISFFIHHRSARDQYITAARARTLQDHTMDARVRRIITSINTKRVISTHQI